MAEKYGRMMKYTEPDYFKEMIEPYVPAVSEEASRTIDEDHFNHLAVGNRILQDVSETGHGRKAGIGSRGCQWFYIGGKLMQGVKWKRIRNTF